MDCLFFDLNKSIIRKGTLALGGPINEQNVDNEIARLSQNWVMDKRSAVDTAEAINTF